MSLLLFQDSPPEKLEDFRWKNRLLLVFGEKGIHPNPSQEDSADRAERKLLIFHFHKGQVKASTEEKLTLDAPSFYEVHQKYPGKNWFLIGLDGGVKSMGEIQDLKLDDIFKRIDSMPMRQSEIRKSGDN